MIGTTSEEIIFVHFATTTLKMEKGVGLFCRFINRIRGIPTLELLHPSLNGIL